MIEALIGLVVLTIIAGALGAFASFANQQSQHKKIDQCRLIANSAMENLKSIGYFRSVADYDSLTYQLRHESVSIPRVAKADLKKISSDPLAKKGNGALELRPYRGLLGSMTYLNELYNKQVDANGNKYCSQNAKDLGGIPLAPEDASASLLEVGEADSRGSLASQARSFLKIELMDPITGQKACPPAPYEVIPQGRAFPAEASRLSGVQFPAVGQFNAFHATITTQIQEGEDQVTECQVSGVFSYPALNQDLVPPVVERFSGVINGEDFTYSSPAVCQTQEPKLAFQVKMPANFKKRAEVILCQDASLSATGGQASCSGGVQTRSFVPSARWVLCSEVTVCGVRASTSEVIEGGETLLRLGFRNLPYGCQASIRAQVVSPSGNVLSSSQVPTAPSLQLALPACQSCNQSVYDPGTFCGAESLYCVVKRTTCPDGSVVRGATPCPTRIATTSGGGGGGGDRDRRSNFEGRNGEVYSSRREADTYGGGVRRTVDRDVTSRNERSIQGGSNYGRNTSVSGSSSSSRSSSGGGSSSGGSRSGGSSSGSRR